MNTLLITIASSFYWTMATIILLMARTPPRPRGHAMIARSLRLRDHRNSTLDGRYP